LATSRINPNAPLEHLRQLTATLRGNLEKCATNPDVDPVHDLRTGTRRVQAMVEAMQRDRADGSLDEAASRWLKTLRKMRRAAAPARDLDVHRKLLAKLVEREKPQEGQEDGSPVRQQAEHLDAWLRHGREHHAAALKKKAAKQLATFDEEAAAFASAFTHAGRTRRRTRRAVLVALESFARLVHEMQQLDAENLHDFRKGTKKARYIAESAADDPQAQAVGKALKKLQDDIGDWHDWYVLAEEARTALGDEGKELIERLDCERELHFAAAMKSVARLHGKLMGEWQAATQTLRR
jgi:CHAD domain-containing protein